jgi:hypothetical protein
MEDKNMLRIGLCAVMVLLCAAAFAGAQECQQETGDFRFVLEGFVADLYEVSDLATQLDYPAAADFYGMVVEFDALIVGLTDEQLEELCAAFERTPSATEIPRSLIDVMGQIGGGQEGVLCLDPTEHYLLLAASLAAELVANYFAGMCDTLGCPVLPNAGCFVSCAANLLFQVLASTAEFLVARDEDNCHGEHSDLLENLEGGILVAVTDGVLINQEALTTKLNVVVSSRASQSSVDGLASEIGNIESKLGDGPGIDIAAELDAITVDLAAQEVDRQAYQELSLRLSIEKMLQPGQTGRISLFQLPRSVGGELEMVREVAASAITMRQDAGLPIHDALHYFSLADGHLNGQRYRAAFTAYRLAYQEAMKPSSEE